MKIGIPKKIKPNENRVSLTTAGTLELTKRGHEVYVETDAGIKSGFENVEYVESGAQIVAHAKDVFDIADMIIKVKEPIEEEYDLIKEGQLVFTYFHFASHEPLTRAMIRRKAICLAYETVELEDRSLPLLVPMSEVAGRKSHQKRGENFVEGQKRRGIFFWGG
ncbi:MAG TPA: alanine dehydrogenase, partial [Mariniflexile sp.]|nr:alanine dehydrogenase [Mariniflexile sp.]